MKLETVKSFILVVLIGISLVLSYSLWSYQPNSNQTIGSEIIHNEMDAGGFSEESKRSLIKPSDIIFHTAEGYYGFLNARDQDSLFTDIQEWSITHFETYNNSSSIEHSTEVVELIFPDEIPMEILDSLFSFQDDIVFPNWSMKRMYISFIDESKSLQIEFISDTTNQSAAALINDATSYEDLRNELHGARLTEYLAINEETNPVYFPAGQMSLSTYSITPTKIRPQRFVNILFTNPAVVRETRSQTIGEVYFTDNRQMSVYQDGMRIEYVSHLTQVSNESERLLSEVELIDWSIMNINSHSGWTYENHLGQEYRLEEVNADQKRVKFQMYYKGYPIFNNYKLSTIEQYWAVYQNKEQVEQYNRPLYTFDTEILSRKVENLPRGEDILTYLKSNPDISTDSVEDIAIGYELKYQREDQQSEYIELVPAWYKKEHNIWQKIIFTDDTIPRGGN